MAKLKDGFYKLTASSVGSNNYALLGGGGQIAIGNASGNVPISNGTLNTNLNADLLDGLQGSWYRKNCLSFANAGLSATNEYDCNKLLDGLIYNYGSASYWKNAPLSLSYGSVLNLKNGSYTGLRGQLAWDVNHDSTTDTTRNLWWRASDDGTFTEAKWHLIAFTDSNISGNAASADVATKLGTTTVGGTYAPIYLNAGTATAGTSYAKAIKGITRSGNTFTYTCIDGTTGTFTLKDNNTYPSAYCDTAAATAAKTAYCTGYTLTSKSYIHVLIVNANSAKSAITLNINGTGAKPIYINGSASSTSNYTLPAGTYIVYYDGSNFYFRTDGMLPGTSSIANVASSVGSGSASGSDHATALSTFFNDNKNSIIRNKLLSIYSSVYNNGSVYMGYFLSGYNSNPYGGFFVAHYDTPYYVGINSGNFSLLLILTKTNYNSYAPKLDGTGATGTWDINISGTSSATSLLTPLKLTNLSLGDYYESLLHFYSGGSNTVTDKPSGVDAFGLLNLRTADGWYGQLLMSSNLSSNLYWRTNTSSTIKGTSWKTLLDSSNYTTYTVKKDGTGASGTWDISVTGNAETATNLAIARKLWGQSFDGTKDINGAITFTDESYINFTNCYLPSSDGSNSHNIYNSNGGKIASFYSDGRTLLGNLGNVGIGTANPGTKLHVAGRVAAVDFISTGNGTGTYNIGYVGQTTSDFLIEGALKTDLASDDRLPITLTWRGGYVNKGGLKITGESTALLGSYTVLHTGNYSSYSPKSVIWEATTTVNAWSRILTISSYCNVLLSICFSLNSQASLHLYLISSGHNCAKISQLGYNNYTNNSAVKIRVTRSTTSTYHIEVYNSYGYSGATTVIFGCKATALDSICTLTPISAYTAGGGTVENEITSSSWIAANFNADMVDGYNASDFVKVAGDTMTGTLVVKTGSSEVGLKFGNSYLNSLNNQLIWQTSEAIRFGSAAWNWNEWAGLKYTHSNKTIYLGIADGTTFNANTALSGGSLRFPGISNVYATTFNGNLSGNATSATTASKVANTLTLLTNGTTQTTFNGSTATTFNVTLINAGSGLLHNSLTTALANTTTDSGWSMINSSYSGYILKSIRTNAVAPAWIEGNYAAGIAFGGADTKGVLSCAYNSPRVRFAGGNGTNPVWWILLTGTSGTTYNLNSMPYASSAGNADTVDGYHASRLMKYGGDWTSTTDIVGVYAFGFGGSSAGLGNNWGSGILLCNNMAIANNAPPSSNNNDANWYSQLLFSTDNRVRARFRTNGSAWSAQYKLLYESDYIGYQFNEGEKTLISGTRTDGAFLRKIYDNGWGLVYYDVVSGANSYIATVNSTVANATNATNINVYQHTTNDVEYPLVWTNLSNSNSALANLLYKSYSHLMYNPNKGKVFINRCLSIGTNVVPGDNNRARIYVVSPGAHACDVLLGADGASYWSISARNAAETGIGGKSLGFWDAVNSTWRMVLTTSGNVGIGTTSPSHKLHVLSSTTATTGVFRNDTAGFALSVSSAHKTCAVFSTSVANTTSSTGASVLIVAASSASWGLYVYGGAYVGALHLSSDKKLKYDIIELSSQDSLVEQMDSIPLVSYKMRDSHLLKYGMIAQDILPYFPELVNYDTDTDTYGVEYNSLLILKIANLERKIKILEEKLALLI